MGLNDIKRVKRQSMAFAILISINAVLGAIGINNAFIVPILIIYFLVFNDWDWKTNIYTFVILFLGLIYVISAYLPLTAVNHYARTYGLYCWAYGILVFGRRHTISIELFFKYTIAIGIVTGPILLFKAISMGSLIGTYEMDSGGMMGITYAVVPGTLIAISCLISQKEKLWNVLSIVLLCFDIIILGKIGSRGAIIIFVVFFLLMTYHVLFRKIKHPYVFIVIIALLVCLLTANLTDMLYAVSRFCSSRGINLYALNKSIAYLNAGSFDNGRINVWNLALKGIQESPFGHEPASFELMHNMHPHNIFLQLGWDWGILGLLVSVGIVVSSIRTVFRKCNDIKEEAFRTTLFCASIVLLMYSATFWALPSFWIWIGLLTRDKKRADNREGIITI